MISQDEDFLSASVRHYNDSKYLHDKGRFDNAAYLAGYVVECGLKAILQLYGHGAKSYKHDITALHGPALDLATMLSPGASRYCSIRPKDVNNNMTSWKTEMRYYRTGVFMKVDADKIMQAARDVFDSVITEMILDNGGF